MFRLLARFDGSQKACSHHCDIEAPTDGTIHEEAFERWATTSYLETLANQIGIAIDQLQTATNWTLTVVLASGFAVISGVGYPNDESLAALAFLTAITAHLSTRSLKGYINVLRWGTLQRSVVAIAREYDPERRATAVEDTRNKINTFHLQWKLPLPRRLVWWKGLTELALGPVWIGVLSLLVYNILNAPGVGIFVVATVASIAWATFEVLDFNFRSPYMKTVEIDEDARKYR